MIFRVKLRYFAKPFIRYYTAVATIPGPSEVSKERTDGSGGGRSRTEVVAVTPLRFHIHINKMISYIITPAKEAMFLVALVSKFVG